MPHPRAFRSTGVEGEVDQCGHDHAAEGGHRRQGGLAAIAQLADGPLAFDLQADDEEEDRHQPVVDDVVEVLGEMERPDRDVDRRRPQRLVAGAPRRVRPHQRHRRRHRQQHPTGRLDTQELGQRASHPGQPGVTVKEGGRPKLPGGWRVHRWHGCPRDTSSEGLPTRLPGAPRRDDRRPSALLAARHLTTQRRRTPSSHADPSPQYRPDRPNHPQYDGRNPGQPSHGTPARARWRTRGILAALG